MTTSLQFRLVASALAFFVVAVPGFCQSPQPPLLPRFDLPTSGLEWRSPAEPSKYFDATGRRAAVLGKQDGKFEAWIWPIKLLHGFRLEFRVEGMPEPVRGEAWLQQVITRPESTTLIYAHPLFTVRQIIWAPLNHPAILMFFDVDSAKPLDITAKFVPDFKPMWPASLGGQHTNWMADDKAFALTDALEQHVAMIGSPAVAAYTDFMDHSLIGGEMLLQMRVTPEQAKRGYAVLAMSLGMAGEKEAVANYRSAIEHAREWYEDRAKYERDFLAHTTQFETPDEELNRAIAWSKIAIDSGWVCTPVPGSAGCGMVAGYGPAGDGERPGFAWWFGGDGLMSGWAQEDYGDVAGALQELRFLRARQRDDGKITHEIVQSVGLVDWFGKFHFPYMHADTTPMYLYSLAQYWDRTGDRKFLEEFWPSAKKAYEWCVSTVDPADGLMDNTKAGLGAVEVGVLRGKVVKDVYLEGFWLAGLNAMRSLANGMRDRVLAGELADRIHKARGSLEEKWWNKKEEYFAFGMSADGQRADMVGNWGAVLVGLNPSISPDDAQEQSRDFARPEIATDWGVRWLSDKSSMYDPVSYNNGTVWPFMNTFSNLAQFVHAPVAAAYASLKETAQLTGIQSPGYMPEHMNGDRYLPGERSVPHQLFSSVGVYVPVARGLFGLQTGGIGYGADPSALLLTVAPALPANWEWARFRGFVIGSARVSGEIRQKPGRLEISLQQDSPNALVLDIAPRLPLAAVVKSVKVNGEAVTGWSAPKHGGSLVLHAYATVKNKAEIVVEYEGGVDFVPPVVVPGAGDRAEGLKIIWETMPDDRTIALTVAGLGGRSYALDLVSGVPDLKTDTGELRKSDRGSRLTIPFEGTGWTTKVVKLTW